MRPCTREFLTPLRPYPTSGLWPLFSDLWPLASDLWPLISYLISAQVDEHGLPVDLPDDEQFIDTELLHGTPQARPLTTHTHTHTYAAPPPHTCRASSARLMTLPTLLPL